MIKKELKYTNFEGEEVKDSLYFNFNQVEQVRFEAKYVTGGYKDLKQYLDDIIEKKETMALVAMIEDIILSSYGVREPDGIHFTKNKAIRENFSNSIAYAELFELFMKNPDEFKKFMMGVFPQKQQATIVQQLG